ncbi:hypothetical protein V6N11_049903 [Hibiscus sabdariffa]|uniref:Uncharacterized protein n=2 Tax=Hibiscus sabdariffa TaxID=183260 RepID=A0ABR2T887_9ROSI
MWSSSPSEDVTPLTTTKSDIGVNEQKLTNGGSRYAVLSRDLIDNQGDRVMRHVLDEIRMEYYGTIGMKKENNNHEATPVEIIPTRERVTTKVVNHVLKALVDSHTTIQIVEHDVIYSNVVGKEKKSTCGSKTGGVEITRKGLWVRKTGDTWKSKSGIVEWVKSANAGINALS